MTLRVGNCSGFYGDRLTAMREMLEGGPLDVLTGDYLAELTMLILGRDQLKDPSLGYARTFLKQAADCLALAKEKDVRIVSNAGGLNPAGLAEALRKVAADQGLDVTVAHVDGDGLMGRDDLDLPEGALTANAYLGAFGIAAALSAGADVVVTGRVTDASVVVGPAIWHFGWGREDLDQLAGAVVAGHVIECGAQATGGNFSGFRELVASGRGHLPLGFPLAEIDADGSCVITKHPGTGGIVTTDTVTAQLVYEIQSARYLGPDVTVRLDTVALSDDGEDRVRISGVRGEAPPDTLKVCVNQLGGFRNQMELVLTGLEIEDKAAWVRAQVEAALRVRPAEMDWSLARTDHPDASTEEAASARLRCVVRDPSGDVVGKGFTGPLIELALASYPGFTATTPPTPATPYAVYRAAYVPQSAVTHTVHLPSGSVVTVEPPVVTSGGDDAAAAGNHPLRSFVAPGGPVPSTPSAAAPSPPGADAADSAGSTTRAPLGSFVHARSGDKGGDANLGLWVSASDPKAQARAEWLLATVTPEWVRGLLPEAADLEVDVVPLPNLHGVNVVLHGLLGLGVAASSRFDPQAKGLGEWARSRHVDIPEELV
ncbi:acyclic terpene utilization AtuA family protein [Nocardioides marmoribigeumensis]|uniref:DUF1446 domain-containing protein n=1 Tax=Nocardioides marmoribigeumensis TaxID=433649 RepID=A0ABU2BVS7_9ACTN|nr:acyclic terpene utilization AtuA family protein [Nocardioides marmoribigeumensis]MDR7362738.1 hypothetical protein [Nocardioides marmoribigeumensis]